MFINVKLQCSDQICLKGSNDLSPIFEIFFRRTHHLKLRQETNEGVKIGIL